MFGRTGSIQLARIFGIRIGVDVSWFVVLFFFIFILSGSFRTTLDSSDTVAYVTAVASALLFFVSLVLHELGHALVARRLGIEILGIDLWFFGGIAKMSRDTETPGAEFKVAVAGPVVTLVVVALCVGLGTAAAGWDTFLDAATLRHNPDATPALVLLGWLASINAFVFVAPHPGQGLQELRRRVVGRAQEGRMASPEPVDPGRCGRPRRLHRRRCLPLRERPRVEALRPARPTAIRRRCFAGT